MGIVKNLTVSRSALLLAASALGTACSALAPTEATMPAGAVPVPVTAQYQQWFEATQSCSGIAGRLETVQFYVVPGVETFETSDGPQVGEWISEAGSHRIIIAGNYRNHEMVVRHELLHALLRQAGHPDEYFVARCRLTWETWAQNQSD